MLQSEEHNMHMNDNVMSHSLTEVYWERLLVTEGEGGSVVGVRVQKVWSQNNAYSCLCYYRNEHISSGSSTAIVFS